VQLALKIEVGRRVRDNVANRDPKLLFHLIHGGVALHELTFARMSGKDDRPQVQEPAPVGGQLDDVVHRIE